MNIDIDNLKRIGMVNSIIANPLIIYISTIYMSTLLYSLKRGRNCPASSVPGDRLLHL